MSIEEKDGSEEALRDLLAFHVHVFRILGDLCTEHITRTQILSRRLCEKRAWLGPVEKLLASVLFFGVNWIYILASVLAS